MMAFHPVVAPAATTSQKRRQVRSNMSLVARLNGSWVLRAPVSALLAEENRPLRRWIQVGVTVRECQSCNTRCCYALLCRALGVVFH